MDDTRPSDDEARAVLAQLLNIPEGGHVPRPYYLGRFAGRYIWVATYAQPDRVVELFICPQPPTIAISNRMARSEKILPDETAFGSPEDFALYIIGCVTFQTWLDDQAADDTPRLLFNDQGQLPSA